MLLLWTVSDQTAMRQTAADLRQCLSEAKAEVEREKQSLQRMKKEKVSAQVNDLAIEAVKTVRQLLNHPPGHLLSPCGLFRSAPGDHPAQGPAQQACCQ